MEIQVQYGTIKDPLHPLQFRLGPHMPYVPCAWYKSINPPMCLHVASQARNIIIDFAYQDVQNNFPCLKSILSVFPAARVIVLKHMIRNLGDKGQDSRDRILAFSAWVNSDFGLPTGICHVGWMTADELPQWKFFCGFRFNTITMSLEDLMAGHYVRHLGSATTDTWHLRIRSLNFALLDLQTYLRTKTQLGDKSRERCQDLQAANHIRNFIRGHYKHSQEPRNAYAAKVIGLMDQNNTAEGEKLLVLEQLFRNGVEAQGTEKRRAFERQLENEMQEWPALTSIKTEYPGSPEERAVKMTQDVLECSMYIKAILRD
jgi:hypothetical protein